MVDSRAAKLALGYGLGYYVKPIGCWPYSMARDEMVIKHVNAGRRDFNGGFDKRTPPFLLI